ncbi:MAG: glycosyltransferase family 2 protein [Ferruginibacter sp.]|nr:glycosyltransferase family 2 protein [Ferruginibacter sp.]
MQKKISVLLPVFNEQNNVDAIYLAVKNIFVQFSEYLYEIIFIDDGSTDLTLPNIIKIAAADNSVLYISFSRNFGKDNALCAGLRKSTGNAVITMDADLQHAPNLITELIHKWESGYEVVYYFRKNKNKHASTLSGFFSTTFYKTLNALSDVKLENGISDFRILDKKVVDCLANLPEDTLFFRGLIKWAGFKQLGLPYNPSERNHGKSTYKTSMLFKLAIQSITSFSTKPLTIAIYLGFVFSTLSILYIPYIIYSKINGFAISGWASIIATIVFFGGLNLMILGIVGLYLGKTFMQGKGRPQYIVSQTNIES